MKSEPHSSVYAVWPQYGPSASPLSFCTQPPTGCFSCRGGSLSRGGSVRLHLLYCSTASSVSDLLDTLLFGNISDSSRVKRTSSCLPRSVFRPRSWPFPCWVIIVCVRADPFIFQHLAHSRPSVHAGSAPRECLKQ